MKALRISGHALVTYLTQIEDHYRRDVPYHNSIHAADVTQSSHFMLLQPALEVRHDTINGQNSEVTRP